MYSPVPNFACTLCVNQFRTNQFHRIVSIDWAEFSIIGSLLNRLVETNFVILSFLQNVTDLGKVARMSGDTGMLIGSHRACSLSIHSGCTAMGSVETSLILINRAARSMCH